MQKALLGFEMEDSAEHVIEFEKLKKYLLCLFLLFFNSIIIFLIFLLIFVINIIILLILFIFYLHLVLFSMNCINDFCTVFCIKKGKVCWQS